ncbi:MAG: N-acetylmuramoyl-L-alanine amidase, partial [bacterium]|nr:N-acetylmuramoyl-L-alanine amidase [bacterium]
MPGVFGLLAFCLWAFSCAAAPLVLKDDYRSPRNKERPLRKATRLIVLHTTEAHAKSALNKLSERGEAHYCVTETGEAYRIIDRDRQAFHAGRSMWNGKDECDEYSIGIEVVGHHDRSMPLRQLEALKELVARLKRTYGIADAQVVCHSHVAYGAPNTWHPKKHRGRKRCGMLFAMPSVRTKLGLRARPAYDPDVRAKRLVQADAYLNSILYGSVDTMAAVYGKGRIQVAAAPSAAPKKKPAAAKAGPKKPKPAAP